MLYLKFCNCRQLVAKRDQCYDIDPSLFQAFVNAQNKLTLPFLERCEVRDLFKERMTELYDYPKYSCPFKRGSR